MVEFTAVIEPKLGLANVGEELEFSCSDRYVADSGDHSTSSDHHLLGASFTWSASPLIVQDNRYVLEEGGRVLRILNLAGTDNNTAVVCEVNGTYGGRTYRTLAESMIRILPNAHHVTDMQENGSTPPTSTITEDYSVNISARNEPTTSLDSRFSLPPWSAITVGSALLALLLVISLLAYRRRRLSAAKSPLRRSLRNSHNTVSRENSYQATRINTAAPRSGTNVFPNIEGSKPSTSFCALPVISISNEDDGGEIYAVPGECESNTVPSRKRSKRYLTPTNNKRKQESHSHVYGRVTEGEYECMDGDPRLRNCVSQPNLKGYQEHRYVNWKKSQSDTRFSAPIYSTQINQNANTDDEGGTLSDSSSTVEYAELDLGTSSGVIHGLRERESSGSVTQYAKILRILSVFRTRKSTRVKVTNIEQV